MDERDILNLEKQFNSSKELLQFPAELVTYKTYATKRNVQVSFELQEELDPNHIAKLLAGKGKTGWLVFNPSETRIEIKDVPDEPVRETASQSPSKRLRSVLFVYWKECTKQTQTFDYFYDEYINKIIENVKSKLPERM